MECSFEESVPSSDGQVTDFSGPPRDYLFLGERFQYDWDSVAHLLGKKTDQYLSELLGCPARTVTRMRNKLGVKRYLKSRRIREVMGRHPDKVAAELAGVARATVTRQRLAEGVPPCPRRRRRDLLRVRFKREMIKRKERR